MRKRTVTIIFCLLLSCAAGYGQTSFKELTPGKSTRADVERVLGPPVGNIADSINYKPPAGVKAVTVWYEDD